MRTYLFITIFLNSILNGIYPSKTFADPSPSPSVDPASISLNDFDSICKNVLNAGQTTSNANDSSSQQLQYCQAAKSAQDAVSSNATLWKVWAAVGGVCVGACAASFAGVGNQYVCIGTNTIAAVAEGIVTKNFAGALMSIMGSGAGYMANQTMNRKSNNLEEKAGKDAAKVEEKVKQKDVGACIIAASAAFQAYSNYGSMKSNEATVIQNLASAQSVAGQTDASVQSNLPLDSAAVNAGLAGSSTTTTGSLVGNSNNTTATQTAPSSNLCSSAQTQASAGVMIQCAVASDSTLPSFVSSPQFPSDFKKASGIDLGDFLSKSDSPSNALPTAMSGQLSSDQSFTLAAALRNLEQGMMLTPVGSTYSHGGGGSNNENGSSDDAQFGNLMSNLMGQLAPKTPSGQNQAGNLDINFTHQNRAPSNLAEDRKVSLFDRVTYRYHFVGQRMTGGTN